MPSECDERLGISLGEIPDALRAGDDGGRPRWGRRPSALGTAAFALGITGRIHFIVMPSECNERLGISLGEIPDALGMSNGAHS